MVKNIKNIKNKACLMAISDKYSFFRQYNNKSFLTFLKYTLQNRGVNAQIG